MLSMAQAGGGGRAGARVALLGFSAVVLLAGWLYLPAVGFDFCGLDDAEYVVDNPYVLHGFAPGSLRYALGSTNNPYWHPLTYLSLMLDAELFGPGPAGFHATNVLLHALTAGVAFLVLLRATAACWPSLLAAALLAAHPLNVEAVAWVAERKSLLAALFMFLAMGAYVEYARRPAAWRMGLVALLHALGLAAKPLPVTLPFLLLLLDWWPLRRLGPQAGGAGFAPRPPLRLVLEKVPLFALTAASLFVSSLAELPPAADALKPGLAMRLAQAVLAYAGILGKAVWPEGLAAFYPAPAAIGLGRVLLVLAGLALATWLGVRARDRWPWLGVGWLWFLGAMVPMLGLVQSGYWPRYADRFAYVPLLGIYLAAAFGAARWAGQGRRQRAAAVAAGVAAVLALGVATSRQLPHWRNPEAVFGRALAVTQGNWLAHNGMGHLLLTRGGAEEAAGHFQEALAARPDFWDARLNLGSALAALGRHDEALDQYREALRLAPRLPEPVAGMGNVLLARGDLRGAGARFVQAIRMDPSFLPAYVNLAVVHNRLGRPDLAEQSLRAALRVDPHYAPALESLALLRGGGRP